MATAQAVADAASALAGFLTGVVTPALFVLAASALGVSVVLRVLRAVSLRALGSSRGTCMATTDLDQWLSDEYVDCPECGGSEMADCPDCEGFGWRAPGTRTATTPYDDDDSTATIDCPECGGSGVVARFPLMVAPDDHERGE